MKQLIFLTYSVIKKGIINNYFFILLLKIFFRASKNDFRASRCWLQLAWRASCKINFLCTLQGFTEVIQGITGLYKGFTEAWKGICMGYWDQVWDQDGWILAKFIFCMDQEEVEVHKLAKNEQGQYPAILTKRTWSIKDLLYGFWGNFACRI